MTSWRTVLCILVAIATAVAAFSPPTPYAVHNNKALSSSLFMSSSSSNSDENDATSTLLQTVWNRMDTLEASGINDLYKDHPPLVARGGGFKRFWIIMGIGVAYKWYRARFINKIPFWEKQPQWNMVVTNKEQEEQLRAYTCQNCGATLFIARNREWFFEGGTGLAGLGCYSCGAQGKDNFVMDRDRIVEDVGDEDDYWDFERPLDFVSAAERKDILRQTKGDEDAANQLLMDAQNKASPKEKGGEKTPPPMFGLTQEEADAKKKKEAAAKKKQAADETGDDVADDAAGDDDAAEDNDEAEDKADDEDEESSSDNDDAKLDDF